MCPAATNKHTVLIHRPATGNRLTTQTIRLALGIEYWLQAAFGRVVLGACLGLTRQPLALAAPVFVFVFACARARVRVRVRVRACHSPARQHIVAHQANSAECPESSASS